MKIFTSLFSQIVLILILSSCNPIDQDEVVHVYEIKEVDLSASEKYKNPYTDVECWVQLKGPGFDKRIYGFWNGGQSYKVRMVTTRPGSWSWESGSNKPYDPRLNGQKGSFTAVEWTKEEIDKNPNRRGFIQATPNGHALQYADGTPFFFLGDTWWSATTWRYPLRGKSPDPDWIPGLWGLSFANMFYYLKKQGYNSLAMIACYPNWAADKYPGEYVDGNGIGIRQAWEKFGTPSAKDMHDEAGNLPFKLKNGGPLADFDQLNPSFFQSMDKKMDYLNSEGFAPFLEIVRRDHGPSWKAYFEWPGSFVRYIQYMVARYGAYNLIFSPIHLDWIPEVYSLTAAEFNEVITTWFTEYGPLPYGQPVTTLIDKATHVSFGTGAKVPWLTMHSVGNYPRNHGFYPLLEEQFNLTPPKPTANLEPYYPGWNHEFHNKIVDIIPSPGSELDNYCGRAQAWGSVLSGGLAGHIYGTGAYDGTTVGEEKGWRPYIWETLIYPAGEQVGHIRKFLLSEGATFQDMVLASNELNPRKSARSHPNGLDGWAFMMCTPNKDLSMIYFENKCEIPEITNLQANKTYRVYWFDPVSGKWMKDEHNVVSNSKGSINLNLFPDGEKTSYQDWALKMKLIE